MICGWASPYERTEQGRGEVGLRLWWYNTYTKKALYCIEFEKGGRLQYPPLCVCVTASRGLFSSEGGWWVLQPLALDDISNIPWKDPVVKHLTLGLFFFPLFSFFFLFISTHVQEITVNLFYLHVSFTSRRGHKSVSGCSVQDNLVASKETTIANTFISEVRNC